MSQDRKFPRPALSRRTLLAGTPVLAMVPASAAAGAAPLLAAVPGAGDDAELLTAFADWLVADREYRAILDREETPEQLKRMCELKDTMGEAVWRILEQPAHTLAGVRAKAHLLRDTLTLNFERTALAFPEDRDEALLLSLVTDILGPGPKLR